MSRPLPMSEFRVDLGSTRIVNHCDDTTPDFSFDTTLDISRLVEAKNIIRATTQTHTDRGQRESSFTCTCVILRASAAAAFTEARTRQTALLAAVKSTLTITPLGQTAITVPNCLCVRATIKTWELRGILLSVELRGNTA